MKTPDYSSARRALMRRDPILGTIIKRHRACELGAARDRFDHFAMLVRAIVFQQLSTKAVITSLTQVKGIGRWTAEMFLIFRLQRPDVLPVGDLGIVNAMQKAYRMRKKPTPERMHKIAEAWRPYRSVASWYLWRSLDNEPVTTVKPPRVTKPVGKDIKE